MSTPIQIAIGAIAALIVGVLVVLSGILRTPISTSGWIGVFVFTWIVTYGILKTRMYAMSIAFALAIAGVFVFVKVLTAHY